MTESSEYFSFPGVQALHVVDVACRFGVDPHELLGGTGFTPAAIEDPATRVDLPAMTRLLSRARELSGEPAFGVYLGLGFRAAHFGYVGFATMSAPTMRAAIELGIRFNSTVTTAYQLELNVSGESAELVLTEHANFGDARDVLLLWTLIGLRHVGQAMTGHDSEGILELAIPRPDYAPRVEAAIPRIRFDRPKNRLSFRAQELDREYMQRDRVALRMLIEQCEKLLDSSAPRDPTARRVQTLLRSSNDRFPTVEHAAAELGMSVRTLKRRLSTENRTFRELLESERCTRALRLVKSNLSLPQIATRLGYSNVANFERAFRRWTASTPAAYRKASDPFASAGSIALARAGTDDERQGDK